MNPGAAARRLRPTQAGCGVSGSRLAIRWELGMPRDAQHSRRASTPKPQRIVVVGGGAGGLELATRLGDKLGRRGKAHVTLVDRRRTHLWKPLLHEIAAGSMDLGVHELDYLAQAHWHHFTFRLGELTASTGRAGSIEVGPYHRRGRPAGDRGAPHPLRHAGDRHRQRDQRLRHAGRCGARHRPRTARAGEAISQSSRQCLHPRPIPDRSRWRRASSASPSSAPVRREPSSPPSCTRRRASSSPTASTASIPIATSAFI